MPRRTFHLILLPLIALPFAILGDESLENSPDRKLPQPLGSRPQLTVTQRPSLFSEEDEFDEDDEEIMGSIFTQFLADSETQLILDMDFFKHFFNYAEAYRL
ncbi:hypothetical protein OESDEN_12142 [Oesophagostomum dentatum]|uniref:Uncharacterized protein n=1 Tax=Oesophagostomum dentatum TaxID=61180 RepID=A0A0B1SSZ7_OESDE|nr:hypothetical protein OESDEN_12142 [Oesophagostomum dentatum]